MKFKEFYELVVKNGIENDPRGSKEISRQLEEVKKSYQKLSEKEKKYFDKDSLFNPFYDTRILSGSLQKEIKKILAGIDIDTSELLLADTLNKRGEKIDLVLSHHPMGKALVQFYGVMDLQVDVFAQQGVSLSASENLLLQRKGEVERKISAANFSKTRDAALLLNLSTMCMHTPADNLAYNFLKQLFLKHRPKVLGDIIDALLEIPEYQYSASENCPPKIINGRKSSRVKKLHYEFTGGTEGPKEIYQKLSNSGVDTIIAMHLSEQHFQAAKEANLNIVMAGHIASDNLGVNCLLDKIQAKHKFEVLSCSGFKRFSHAK